MDIRRIDNYRDPRFSQAVLNQHGAYLVDGEPYELEITGPDRAVVRGGNRDAFPELIEAFRFHAPHIIRYSDERGSLLACFPEPERIDLPITRIQPSQFYVDREKLAAVTARLIGVSSSVLRKTSQSGPLPRGRQLSSSQRRTFGAVCVSLSME